MALALGRRAGLAAVPEPRHSGSVRDPGARRACVWLRHLQHTRCRERPAPTGPCACRPSCLQVPLLRSVPVRGLARGQLPFRPLAALHRTGRPGCGPYRQWAGQGPGQPARQLPGPVAPASVGRWQVKLLRACAVPAGGRARFLGWGFGAGAAKPQFREQFLQRAETPGLGHAGRGRCPWGAARRVPLAFPRRARLGGARGSAGLVSAADRCCPCSPGQAAGPPQLRGPSVSWTQLWSDWLRKRALAEVLKILSKSYSR